MMMSFCKKSVHSFLGFTTTDSFQSSSSSKPPWKSHHTNDGLGLITAVSDNTILKKSPNVIISSSVNKSSSSSSSSSISTPKKDPGWIDIGVGVDGLMSCTESLGFESSDERLINQMEEEETVNYGNNSDWKMKTRERRVVVKKFPPPLSSLNQHGHPKFYLHPVRKDGRLELTEIRIERPEILRAYRQNGRLRLNLIIDEQDKEEEEEDVIHEELEEEDNIVKERDGKRADNPVTGDGFRRCIEVVNHRHHRDHHRHHLDVWRQHCVTIS